MVRQINRRQFLGAMPITALGLASVGHHALAAPNSSLQAELGEDQTLRLSSWGLPSYIRPSNEGGPLRMMTQNTFRPPFLEDEAGNLVPGVCTDWSVSEDGLTYTLTMDPQARFSDGSQVTAADLKFSWEYLTYPETQTWSAPFVTRPIVGYDDVASGATQDMAGLVVVDDATLEINLSEPYAPFILAISTYIAGVIKRENALSGDDWDENPVCCGPYQLESWNKDAGELTWVVNEHWWGPAPTIQRVTYQYIQDVNTQSIVYDNDEVDVMHPSDILSAQMKAGAQADELYTIPYGGTVFFMFDTTREPMEDVNVRRALLKASDMGTIIQAIYQEGARPAFGLTPPNLTSFADPEPYFDPDGARQALAESSYGSADNLPPISVRIPAALADYVRVLEALQEMWREILGVEITISPYPQGDEADDGISQIFRLSFGTLFRDPVIATSGLGLSTGSYMRDTIKAQNEELDAILTEANRLPVEQEDERIALSQQAEQILMDQAYYIPIIWLEYYFARKPWVQGLASNSSLALYTLPEMVIAER